MNEARGTAGVPGLDPNGLHGQGPGLVNPCFASVGCVFLLVLWGEACVGQAGPGEPSRQQPVFSLPQREETGFSAGAGDPVAGQAIQERVFASPDGRYRLTLGKDLVVCGSGTVPAMISANFVLGLPDEEGVDNLFWSPDGRKVAVTTRRGRGGEHSGLAVAAWLEGTAWRASVMPSRKGTPYHCRADDQRVLGWASDDAFVYSSVILLNGGGALPPVVCRVRVMPTGLKTVE